MAIELGINVGKFADDGSVEVEPVYSAFSGLYARGNHHSRQRVSNTPYYYYILADEEHLVSDEWRLQFADAVRATFGNSGAPVEAAPFSSRKGKASQAEKEPEE